MFDYNPDVCMVTMMRKDVCNCERCRMRRKREKEEEEKRKKALKESLKEYSGSHDYDEESGPARSWSYEHEGLTVPWRGTKEWDRGL